MKKQIIVTMGLFLCLLSMSVQTFAANIHSNWPPAGWQKLAEGVITDVSNTGPFDVDSFFVRINGQIIFFTVDAPLATEKTVNRAHKQAMLFYAMGLQVKVHGVDLWSGLQINLVQ